MNLNKKISSILLAAYGSFSVVEVLTDKLLYWYNFEPEPDLLTTTNPQGGKKKARRKRKEKGIGTHIHIL